MSESTFVVTPEQMRYGIVIKQYQISLRGRFTMNSRILKTKVIAPATKMMILIVMKSGILPIATISNRKICAPYWSHGCMKGKETSRPKTTMSKLLRKSMRCSYNFIKIWREMNAYTLIAMNAPNVTKKFWSLNTLSPAFSRSRIGS